MAPLTMPDDVSSAFQRKLAERRAREAQAKGSAPAGSSDDFADLIPDDLYDRTDADKALDDAVAGIDIIAGYQRWCGKMNPKVHKGQRESIMISCPKPSHPDKTPSAWINLDKQTWFCGTCQEGGDVHDIAAYGLGFSVPGYKTGSDFHKLRIQMAKDFGFTFHEAPGGVTYIEAPIIEPEPSDGTTESSDPIVAVEEPTVSEDEQLATVEQIFDDGDLPQFDAPSLDWRAVVPKNTFLDAYMNACRIDDVAEEYHFWNGLIAVGFAAGRMARLYDLQPVFGNLFVCTLGMSGSGKSKAERHLNTLIKEALPHDWTDPSSRGVKRVNTPGSAEVLISNFMKPIADPSSPKTIMYYAPVTGLISFNELSALVGRANRMGNVLKPTLMEFYDMQDMVSTSSLTSGSKEAHEPFASALTTTQPAALRTLLGRADDDSGFLNRWVFVAGPEKKKVAIGGARVDITPAIAPLQSILAWSGTFGDDDFVEWGPEAAEKFTKFFDERMYPDKLRAQSALITRIDLLMKKIVLLLSANKREKIVSGKTVEEAISMYQYLLDCYAMPERELGRTLGTEIDDAIIYHADKQFKKDGKGITINQLVKALKRRNYPKDMLVKHIDTLVKLDILRVETSQTGTVGRPTTRYKYVG